MMKSPNFFDTTIRVISNKILRFRYILLTFSKYMNFSDIKPMNQGCRTEKCNSQSYTLNIYTKNIQTGENL